jgi:hypothetical protein
MGVARSCDESARVGLSDEFGEAVDGLDRDVLWEFDFTDRGDGFDLLEGASGSERSGG